MKRRILLSLLLVLLATSSAWATFTAPTANDRCYKSNAGLSTDSCTTTNTPIAGNVAFVHVMTFTGLTLTSVKDQSNNALTIHGCSATNDGTAGTSCLASYVIPSSVAGGQFTYVVTGGTCGFCSITVNMFAVSGGTATFDKKDTTGNGTGTVNTPTIAPAVAGELYFAGCVDENNCTAPTGAWTSAEGVGDADEEAAYILSVSASTAVGFTGFTAAHYDSVIGAYKIVSSTTPKSFFTVF